MLKLIATDMDGTWLNHEGDYDHHLFEKLLKQMRQKNVVFVVNSGDDLANLRGHFSEYADQLYYVIENGSMVVKGRQVMHIEPLSDQSLKNILAIEKKSNFPFIFCGVRSAYVRKKDGLKFFNRMRKLFRTLKQVDDFEDIVSQDRMLKASFFLPHEQLSQYVEKLSKEYPETEFVSGSAISIDMLDKGMDKSIGLRYLGQRLGIDSKEMIAFGDSGNDVAMLKYVGHSYATAQALPSAKRAADEIIGSNDESAVQLKLLQILKQL